MKETIIVRGLVPNKELYYVLVNIHFHTHSEHTINNKSYPLEMHMVHKLYPDQEQYTNHTRIVVGVLFNYSATPNQMLTDFDVQNLSV